MSLLLAMFEGLADPDKNCSRAATVMINSLLKERGGVLQEKVSCCCLALALPPWSKCGPGGAAPVGSWPPFPPPCLASFLLQHQQLVCWG